MHETVLIATDGSEEVERAVNYGIDLAEAFDAEVHVLYVVETEATYILTVGLSDKDMEKYEEYGEEVVTGVVERATDRGLDGRGTVRKGRVAEEIVEYADQEVIDAVVMGSAYRGKIGNLIGGTTDKVVRSATVPVITKRMSADEVR